MSGKFPVDAHTLCINQSCFSRKLSSIAYPMLFLSRVAGAINYMHIKSSDSNGRGYRISKSGAVLVGFYIFHSLPNILLASRSGRRKYSLYSRSHSSNTFTRVVEVFLLGAGLTHAVLSSKKMLMRWLSGELKSLSGKSSEMLVTGLIILFLMTFHLLDFRFSSRVEEEEELDRKVLELLDREQNRVRNMLYWLFVATVAVHAWKGSSSPGWLYRLGFRRKEIPVLGKLCKCLIVVASVLYCIPLGMENPYGKKVD